MFIDLHNDNKDIFFSELSNTLSLATRKYENILIIGNLNIDTSNRKKDNGTYLSNLCDTASLKSLITHITCVKSTNRTSIDVLLTNKSKCFHLTSKNFLRKILNIGITKTLTKIIFFKNLTKNLAKGLSIRKNIITMMSLQIFLEWFLINTFQ